MSLQEVLRDLEAPDPARRKGALVRLVRSRDSRATPYLERMARADPSAGLRYLARKGLGYLDPPRARAGTGAVAVGSAANAGRDPARGPGAAAASDPGGGRDAGAGLPAGPAPADAAAIRRGLASDDPAVRIRAVRAARDSGDLARIALVVPLLSRDPDVAVISTILEALGHLGDPRLVRHLAPFLKHRDPRLRANCIEAMGRLDSDEARAYLVPHLRDPDNRARGNAVLALRRGGRVNIYRTLEGMITSPEPAMQDSAAFCLGRLGASSEAFRLLGLAAESRYVSTRNQVRGVLRRWVARGVARAEGALERLGPEDEAEDIAALLEQAPAPAAASAAPRLSPAERAAAVRRRLDALAAGPRGPEAPGPEAPRPEGESGARAASLPDAGGDSGGEVLRRLTDLSGVTEVGEGELERRSREITARLAGLTRASDAAEGPGAAPDPGDDGGGVLGRLAALGEIAAAAAAPRPDPAAARLEALRALSAGA